MLRFRDATVAGIVAMGSFSLREEKEAVRERLIRERCLQLCRVAVVG